MKYSPKNRRVTGNGIILKRLSDIKDYREVFITNVLEAIQNDYDEVTPEFARNLIAIDGHGDDPYGYFTLGKEVWAAFDLDDDFIGFEVITRKRGGSIKLGPTVVCPQKRGKQYAFKIISLLLDIYRGAGARKVYVTAPMSNEPTLSLDFAQLELQLEAILGDHYREGSAERVCGRLLMPATYKGFVPRVGYIVAPIVTYKNGVTVSEEVMRKFVIQNMRLDYDDIDISFTKAILRGATQKTKGYERKPKIVLTLLDKKKLVGLSVIAPKRGGTYKVAPFLVAPTYRSRQAVELLASATLDKAQRASCRKLTYVLPVRDCNIITVLTAAGFYGEGILRSPYKPGCDMVVLSKKLK